MKVAFKSVFSLLLVFGIQCEQTSTENEDTLLDRSLKTFKKDFNKLTENAEKFLEDFVRQIEEAGKMVGVAYQSDDEQFNWQDNESTKLPPHMNMVTTTPHTNTYVPYAYNKILKQEPVSEISNDIPERKKRSANEINAVEAVPVLPRPRKITQNLAEPIRFQQPEPTQVILGSQRNPQENRGDPICNTSKQNEQIAELKSEVGKLGKLVDLLKDQNELLNKLQPKSHPDKIDTFLDSTTKELISLKTDLRKTEENLSQANKLITQEKNREEMLEKELKRLNTELKFVKAMMENLYDQGQNKREGREDSLLGQIQPDKLFAFQHPFPTLNKPSLHPDTNSDLPPSSENNITTPATKTKEELEEERIQQLIDTYEKFLEGQKFETLNSITTAALLELTKSDPNRFKKFYINEFEKPAIEGKDKYFFYNSSQIETDKQQSNRASGDSLDDLKLRLKLLDALTNSKDDGKDIIKSLVQPEKKSDDEALEESLKLLLEAKKKQKNEESLKNLLKSLSASPQGKTEDVEVELAQLQKAIDSLRTNDNGFGLRQENTQDFQSMLSQIINQNSAIPSIASGPAAIGPVIDKNPTLLNRYIAPQVPTSSSYYGAPVPPAYKDGFNIPNPYSYAPNSYLYPANKNYNFLPFREYYNPSPTSNFPYLANNPKYTPSAIIPTPYLNNQPSLEPQGKIHNQPSYLPQTGPQSDNENKFFPYSSGGYEGYNYGSKSSAGPSLGQSYAIDQTSEQYKTWVVEDLKQQIQNLENVIGGLRSGGYYHSQNSDDTATVTALEQRIYDLKGVLSSLNAKPPGPLYQQSPAVAPHPTSLRPSLPAPAQGPADMPPYQPAPQSKAPPTPQPYQPKEAGIRRSRRKRQVVPSEENAHSDVENSLSQITDVFKKYLVEPQVTPSYPENRANALDNLQDKLNDLKIQITEALGKVLS